MKKLELLAPARDLNSGITAIDHGADAVYIGGPQFGARAAAGNTMSDIADLCCHAHLFGAKVYMVMNTILFDHELEAAKEMATEAWESGVDALIVQDMAFLEMDLPPIPLFASTQMNNVSADHIRFLESAGISRVILARELSLPQIKSIRSDTNIPLEAFVHGALCVSYSGRCYMSAAMGGRSANRGSCGQPCRLAWDLYDEKNHPVLKQKHVLSLRDMRRDQSLEDLINSGITSFKIEGRLKDTAYVKNIVAHYSNALNEVIARKKGFKRASIGRAEYAFTPDPEKTFYRGGTDYFLYGRGDMAAMDSPKSSGKLIGKIKRIAKDHLVVKTSEALSPGDGLCFKDKQGTLHGFRADRVMDNAVYPRSMKPLIQNGLTAGSSLWRNLDHQFSKTLGGETAIRTMAVDIHFSATGNMLTISATSPDGIQADISRPIDPSPARDKDQALKTIEKQLKKLGNTPFHARNITIDTEGLFFRAGDLNAWRRELVDQLTDVRRGAYTRAERPAKENTAHPYPTIALDFNFNISNRLSRNFYQRHGVTSIEPAFESSPRDNAVVMTTRHCIRHAMGKCLREKSAGESHPGPWTIRHKGRSFKLVFDCKKCEMKVVAEDSESEK